MMASQGRCLEDPVFPAAAEATDVCLALADTTLSRAWMDFNSAVFFTLGDLAGAGGNAPWPEVVGAMTAAATLPALSTPGSAPSSPAPELPPCPPAFFVGMSTCSAGLWQGDVRASVPVGRRVLVGVYVWSGKMMARLAATQPICCGDDFGLSAVGCYVIIGWAIQSYLCNPVPPLWCLYKSW